MVFWKTDAVTVGFRYKEAKDKRYRKIVLYNATPLSEYEATVCKVGHQYVEPKLYHRDQWTYSVNTH